MTTDAQGKPAIRRVLQDSSLYLIGNVVGRLVGFFAIPFYAAYLTPAQYGLIELVELSTQTIAIVLGLQAIGTALSRVFHDQDNARAENEVVSTALIATAGFSALITIVAVATAPALSQLVFHTTEWTGLLRAAFIAMFLGEMTEVALVYERIRNRARFFLGYTLISITANLGLNIFFIAGMGFGVWGFVSSKLIVTGLACLYLLFRVQRDVGWTWNFTYIPAFVKFGAPLILSSLSYFAIHFSDRFFLSGAVDLAELGRYALAYRFAILVSALVGDSFNKSWSVTIYRYANQPGWQAQFARVATYLTFVLFFTGMGIALFSPEVLRIMVPPDYMPHLLLLPLLVAAYVIREIGDFFAMLLLINKRTLLVGRIALAMALLNLAANATLIPSFGVFGAAWATAITWAVYLVVCWVIAHREHRLPVSISAYLRVGALAGAVYAVAALTHGLPVILQLGVDGLWLLLFCVLAFFLFFDAEDRRGALAIVGAGLLWLIGRAPSGPLPETGPAVVVIGAAGRAAALLPGALPILPDDDMAQPGASSWALRIGGLATSGVERLVEGGPSGWLRRSHRAALATLHPEAVLLSAGPPASAHLLALALKRRHGLPWIAELDEARAGTLRGRAVDPLLRRAIVGGADAVLAPAGLAVALRSEHAAAAARIHDLPDGPDDGTVAAILASLRPGAGAAPRSAAS